MPNQRANYFRHGATGLSGSSITRKQSSGVITCPRFYPDVTTRSCISIRRRHSIRFTSRSMNVAKCQKLFLREFETTDYCFPRWLRWMNPAKWICKNVQEYHREEFGKETCASFSENRRRLLLGSGSLSPS